MAWFTNLDSSTFRSYMCYASYSNTLLTKPESNNIIIILYVNNNHGALSCNSIIQNQYFLMKPIEDFLSTQDALHLKRIPSTTQPTLRLPLHYLNQYVYGSRVISLAL